MDSDGYSHVSIDARLYPLTCIDIQGCPHGAPFTAILDEQNFVLKPHRLAIFALRSQLRPLTVHAGALAISYFHVPDT